MKKYPFKLSHCWLKIKDFPKWKESFAAWYKDGAKKRPGDSRIDVDKDGPSKDQPRGHTNLQ
jgi:hypothetical protein